MMQAQDPVSGRQNSEGKGEQAMVHVIATSQVRPGCREAFLKLLRENLPRVRAEAGCRAYTPCLDVEGGPRPAEPDVVTILETWESLVHLRAHFETPHMKAFVAAAQPLRSASSARIVEPV